MSAALGAWALMLPVRVMVSGGTYLLEILLDLGLAVLVGSTAGLLAWRREQRRSARHPVRRR